MKSADKLSALILDYKPVPLPLFFSKVFGEYNTISPALKYE